MIDLIRAQTQRLQRHEIPGEPEQLPRTPIRDPECLSFRGPGRASG